MNHVFPLHLNNPIFINKIVSIHQKIIYYITNSNVQIRISSNGLLMTEYAKIETSVMNTQISNLVHMTDFWNMYAQCLKNDNPNNVKPHMWCNGQRARLECGRSWVRCPIGSNPRLKKWYLLLLRYARRIKEKEQILSRNQDNVSD